MQPVALTVAGSDPSGGAGLQADLKVFQAHRVYGQAVPALLTVQDTRGVREVAPVGARLVRAQLEALFEDMPPAAMKTGALPDADTVVAIAEASHGSIPLVVDPVLISSSGRALAAADVIEALRQVLIPRCTLVTPNLAEAEALTGLTATDPRTARAAGEALLRFGARAALITGGHLKGAPVDLLVTEQGEVALSGERIVTQQTHGTGCTYTAAITARLARGEALVPAITAAKRWLTEALRGAPGLGRGVGPLDFFADGTD